MKKSLLIVLLTSACAFLLLKYGFQIKTLEIKGQEECVDREIFDSQLNVKGKNIFLVNPQSIEKTLKGKNACIDSVNIQKKLPSKLIFTVVSQKPVAKVDGADLVVTSNGLVMKTKISITLPTLYLPSDLKVQEGAKIEDTLVLFALKLTSDLLKSDFIPSSIRFVGSRDIAVYSTSETVALFTAEKSPGSQVDSLQAILTKAKIDASKITKLDLRFDKPVITGKK